MFGRMAVRASTLVYCILIETSLRFKALPHIKTAIFQVIVNKCQSFYRGRSKGNTFIDIRPCKFFSTFFIPLIQTLGHSDNMDITFSTSCISLLNWPRSWSKSSTCFTAFSIELQFWKELSKAGSESVRVAVCLMGETPSIKSLMAPLVAQETSQLWNWAWI